MADPEIVEEEHLGSEPLKPDLRRLPRPAPTRIRARANALVIPPRPTTQEELVASLRSVSYLRRPRTARQRERQFRAFQLWAEKDTSIAEIARRLRVSRETARADLYFEGIRRKYGPESPYPERRVLKSDVTTIFKAWGLSTSTEILAFVRELRDRESPIIKASEGEK